jgi:hypothetical protein
VSPGEVTRALLRRWYVLLLAAVLTAAGAHHVLRPGPRFVSTAVIVVKPPVTGNQPNQFANLQPPLAAVSYAVIQQLRSPAGAAELRARGVAPGSYSVEPRNSGTSVTPQYLIPSLQVQVRYRDAVAADAMVRAVIAAYGDRLRALQDAQKIPTDARMSADLLVPPDSVAVSGTRSRALAGVALSGAVGGVLGALWTDRLAGALRRRRPRRPTAAGRAGPATAA